VAVLAQLARLPDLASKRAAIRGKLDEVISLYLKARIAPLGLTAAYRNAPAAMQQAYGDVRPCVCL
jgi:hypothetical protein